MGRKRELVFASSRACLRVPVLRTSLSVEQRIASEAACDRNVGQAAVDTAMTLLPGEQTSECIHEGVRSIVGGVVALNLNLQLPFTEEFVQDDNQSATSP